MPYPRRGYGYRPPRASRRSRMGPAWTTSIVVFVAPRAPPGRRSSDSSQRGPSRSAPLPLALPPVYSLRAPAGSPRRVAFDRPWLGAPCVLSVPPPGGAPIRPGGPPSLALAADLGGSFGRPRATPSVRSPRRASPSPWRGRGPSGATVAWTIPTVTSPAAVSTFKTPSGASRRAVSPPHRALRHHRLGALQWAGTSPRSGRPRTRPGSTDPRSRALQERLDPVALRSVLCVAAGWVFRRRVPHYWRSFAPSRTPRSSFVATRVSPNPALLRPPFTGPSGRLLPPRPGPVVTPLRRRFARWARFALRLPDTGVPDAVRAPTWSALGSSDTPIVSTTCLGTGPLVCAEMNHRIFVGAKTSKRLQGEQRC